MFKGEGYTPPYVELSRACFGDELKSAFSCKLPGFQELDDRGGILYRYVLLSDSYTGMRDQVTLIQKKGTDKYWFPAYKEVQASPVIDLWRYTFHNALLVYDGISPEGLSLEAGTYYSFKDPSEKHRALCGVVGLIKPPPHPGIVCFE